jgi:hypothetical protein
MFVAAAIHSSLVAVLLVASGRGKLVKNPQQMKVIATVGFPEEKLWLLAAAEIAGAAGIVGGLFWWPIGVAAAIGVVLYFVGAIGSHLRVKDKKFTAALVMLLVTVGVLVLRAITA